MDSCGILTNKLNKMKTALEQLESWIEQFYKINGTPTLDDIKGQINLLKDYETEQLAIPRVSNCATSMEEILNEAQRRKAKHSVQYADYGLDTWTVANDLLEHRKKALLADGSVRKVRIEYEM